MLFSNFFIIILFCALNLLILFFIKTRTSRIIALISSHLLIILLFNIYLKSFTDFKEVVLVVSIYSMIILFFISNNKSLLVSATAKVAFEGEKYQEKNILFAENSHNNLKKVYFPIIVMITGATIGILLIANYSPQIKKTIQQRKIQQIKEVAVNPLILPSHPVHMNVKKFYLGKKYEEESSDEVLVALEERDKKRVELKNSLTNNVILKRISDIILIIVALICALLILSNKKHKIS